MSNSRNISNKKIKPIFHCALARIPAKIFMKRGVDCSKQHIQHAADGAGFKGKDQNAKED
jgi:hypothetical protein